MASQASGAAAPLFALLRSILRLHRQRLPPPMRGMGDTYVVSEFRRHLRGRTTEAQWRTFVAEWRQYAAMLGGMADRRAALAPGQAGDQQQHPQQQQQQQQQGQEVEGNWQGDEPTSGSSSRLASVTAAIAAGSSDMTEQLLQHLSADQRRQLLRLQQEAAALGAEMLGKRPGGSYPADGTGDNEGRGGSGSSTAEEGGTAAR